MTSTRPDEFRVEANGLTFAALAWGDPGDPLALCVHGYPDTAWTWRHLGPHLAERGWRAVAPFTRGYAPTDLAPDGSYLIRDLAQDVVALHTALGGDDRAVLIGHDWGALATYGATALDPSRFHRYLAMSVPPLAALLAPFRSLKTLPLGARQARMSWYFLYSQLPGLSERGQDRVIPKLWRDWSPGYDAREDLAHVFEALRDTDHRRAALRYYRNNLQKAPKAAFTVAPKAPVLYLHGVRDGCLHAELGRRYAGALMPAGSRLELVEGVGHFMQLEDPPRINAMIDQWVGVPQRAAAPQQ